MKTTRLAMPQVGFAAHAATAIHGLTLTPAAELADFGCDPAPTPGSPSYDPYPANITYSIAPYAVNAHGDYNELDALDRLVLSSINTRLELQ